MIDPLTAKNMKKLILNKVKNTLKIQDYKRYSVSISVRDGNEILHWKVSQ